jgi:hypothetical protein
MRLLFCIFSLVLAVAAAEKPGRLQDRVSFTRALHVVKSSERDARNVEYSPLAVRGGGYLIPAGWNPFGYKITALGEEFLAFDGSLDSDVGRFIASLKAKRVTTETLKASWLEIVRASKAGQCMRVYRKIDELIQFCLKAGLID